MTLHCHLVLLGQVGAGKSVTGNTIVGVNTFQSRKSLKGVTQDVQGSAEVTIDGLTVDVYDTPGFLAPGVQKGEIESKCQTLLRLDASVPTVFLLVISTDRFAEQEKEAADLVLNFLGYNNLQNTRIIFTKGDELKSNNITVEEYMEESEELKELVQKLNNRYLVFNNRHDLSNREQAEELIKQIRADVIIPQNQLSNSAGLEEPHHNHTVEHLRDQSSASPTGDAASPTLPHEVPPTPLPDEEEASQTNVVNHHPCRILLLGKTGVGKSATGNTILGRKVFRSENDVNAVTTESSKRRSNINGREVSVIDTPGFFDTKLEKKKAAEEFGRSLHLSRGGVHAFLLIFKYGRFTEQEVDVFRSVKDVFGKHVTKHIIIVFTHGDELDPEKLHSGIQRNELLKGVINECGGRYHVFNNRNLNNREQVSGLLEMIDTMLENERIYTNEMLKIANMGTLDYVLHILKDYLSWVIQILRGGRNGDTGMTTSPAYSSLTPNVQHLLTQ